MLPEDFDACDYEVSEILSKIAQKLKTEKAAYTRT